MIGGWRAGEGGRTSGIGALMIGVPEEDGLVFAGRVGTGFTDKDLATLKEMLAPLHTDESPFTATLSGPDAKGVTFVEPTLVGGRCGTASARLTVDSGNPAGAACGRTRVRTRWCGNRCSR